MIEELVKDTNTFVTMEEADDWIKSRYRSASPEYQTWFASDVLPSDKVAVLLSSADSINRLQFRGKKAVNGQSMEFPRTNVTYAGLTPVLYYSQLSDNTLVRGNGRDDGLANAKKAQIVNAVAMLATSPETESAIRDQSAKGIKARRFLDSSEEYNDSNTSTQYRRYIQQGIYAKDKVWSYLSAWLTDDFHSLS